MKRLLLAAGLPSDRIHTESFGHVHRRRIGRTSALAARMHLRGFFQRVLDRDASNIIICKAVAAAGGFWDGRRCGFVDQSRDKD